MIFMIVQVYYHNSETWYTFGAFNDKNLQPFLDKIAQDTNAGEPVISILNDPSTYGTGKELANV